MATKRKYNKILVDEVSQIIDLENKISALYEKKTEIVQRLFGKYGESTHVVSHRDKEFPFIRITLIDNVKKLRKNGVVFRPAKIESCSIETRPLKTNPEDK